MPHAVEDLQSIYDYIAQDSPENALNIIDLIISREHQLLAHPHSGRVVPEMNRDDIREVIQSSYRVIYKTTANSIDVLTIMHGAKILREIPGVSIK